MSIAAEPQRPGRVKAIAQRPADGDPMSEVPECHVNVNTGIVGENRPPGKRSVTLLSAVDWADTCRVLGADLPWWTRRANFLIDGFDLHSTIGRAILIGTVRLWVHGESKPCRLMDEQYDGLRAALLPNGRGGVYGQVLTEGIIRVGDSVRIAPPPARQLSLD